ncbi:hypothetical protein NC652_020975 [Populus alba x Populus x berolinensis]|nr:hypothetical protein NC652_020975 [Populus alba x Populus x berolinensis]
MQNLPILSQIERLKFGTRQGPTTLPTLDKAQAAKIQEQETLLRAAVNVGDGRTYHPSFVLYACRPTCIWRPEADYISTSSVLGRCVGCLMECIAFLILLNEQSQMHDLQGQAQQKFRPFCLVIRNSNMLLEIPNMSSTISSQLLVSLLQGCRIYPKYLINCSFFFLYFLTLLFFRLISPPEWEIVFCFPYWVHAGRLYSTRVSNPGGVMPIQQQQLGSREAFGNMQPNAQNLQSSMAITVYFS